jgi:hypothetical protein
MTWRLYLAGGLLALIALLAGYGAWQAGKAATALEKVDAMQQQLTALQAGVQASNDAIEGLHESMGTLARKAVTIRERVISMERNDASVRAVLDVPLPPDGCLLDDTCTTGTPIGGPAPTVRPASATAQ